MAITGYYVLPAVAEVDEVKAIAAGEVHSLALKRDGSVWACGGNANGELGGGDTTLRATPVQMMGLQNVVAIAAGSSHSLALKDDGTVWACGNNTWGQLGDGTTFTQLMPKQV